MAAHSSCFDASETAETLKITFDSDLKNIDRACECSMAFLKKNAAGVDRYLFSVNLAMREGLTNAVRHGNRFDKNKQVFCQVSILPGQLIRIIIIDQGSGFDWQAVEKKSPDDAAEHGRGLSILRLYCSSYRFNDKGNQLILEKDLSS